MASPIATSISPIFADILRAGRPQFNARVAAARHRYPTFNSANFSGFLIESVDPLVQAVHLVAPEYCASVAVAAYDIALDLVARELAGPHIHTAPMTTLWREIFPAVAPRVAEHPSLVLGALCNALVNVSNLTGGHADKWLLLMQIFATRVISQEQLLSLGLVAAWCAGAAHFRVAALGAAGKLPEALVLELLGADNTVSLHVLLQNLANNPWWLLQKQTAKEQKLIKEVGTFSGFGGIFSTPPQVRVNTDGFVVKSGDRCHLLIADAYGAIFLPANEDEFEAAHTILPGTRLLHEGKNVELNLPVNGLAYACNEHTVAVTSTYSFAVTLVPR